MIDGRMLRRVASTMLHTMVALLFNLGGLLAGRFIVSSKSPLVSYPWFIALLPPILTVRGDISGIFSGRITTMLHIGTARPSLRGNTGEYYNLVRAVIVLTIVDSVGISLISYAFNLMVGQASLGDLVFYGIIPAVTCILTVSITNPLTTLMASGTFRLGLDPDYLVYPAMATVNDITVSALYTTIASLALNGYMEILLLIFTFSTLLVLYYLYTRRGEETFITCVKQGAPSVLFSSFLATFSGVALARVRDVLEARSEVLVIYPALMSSLGALGSILGSVATTQIALGIAGSGISYVKSMFKNFALIEASAIPVYSLYAFLGSTFCKMTGIPADFRLLLAISLFNNVIGFIAISALALVVAFGTFRRGWDPDHFVIPVVTSVSDVLSTMLIFASLMFTGLL